MEREHRYTVYGQVSETASALSPVLGIPKADLETALRVGMRHVPHDANEDDRFDVLQGVAAHLLEVRPPSGGSATGYARNWVRNWTRGYHYRNHDSLELLSGGHVEDESMEDANWYRDQLVGSIEFASHSDDRIDAQRIWNQLPGAIKPIILKRMQGKRLSGAERVALMRARKQLVGITL